MTIPDRRPAEMREEAAAIRQLLEIAATNRTMKSSAEFYREKVERGAQRLIDAARRMEAGNGKG